ncbi:MAG: PKD domain-containing protein, partial [Bacteroidetes bacterium]|nr:PKD domain-containing protein [Bacteroidota bacterium]
MMTDTIKYVIVLLAFIVLKSTVYGQYAGGDASGGKTDSIYYSVCGYPEQFYACLGGNGDGFTIDSANYTTCSTPVQFFAYMGGIADGMSIDSAFYISCATPEQFYAFMGGTADGFGIDTAGDASCGTPPQFYVYFGGNADGYSYDTLMNTTCATPPQFFAYFGGTGDGFDPDTISNCPTSPPVADFTVSSTEVCAGDTVAFTDTSTNYPADWEWSFQGGTPATSSVQNPVITYSTPGVYDVQLIATNYIGMDTVVKSAFITVHAAPVISLGSDIAFCDGDSDTLIAPSGYSAYEWNDASANDSLIVTLHGNYSVTVTDAYGCTGDDDIDVTVYSLPSVDLGSDTSACEGSVIALNAGAGFTAYNWSDGSTANQWLNVTTADTYGVTVSDSHSCTATDEITVSFIPGPSVAFGNDTTLCIGASLTLTPGTGFSGYYWSTTETTDSIEVTTGAGYSVTVTDGNGCSGFDTVNVAFVTTVFPDLGNDTAFCTGNSIALDAGSYTTYTWQDVSTLQILDVNTSGTYSVTVTNPDGCIGSDNIMVTVNTLPVVDLGADINACEGDSALLDAGPGFVAYIWSEGTTAANAIYIETDDVYYVTVTDGNGCENSDSITVVFHALPVVDLGADADTCEGNTVTLDAGTGFISYAWSDGTTGLSVIGVTTSGTYGVTVTDSNGCEGSDTVDVTFNPLPDADLGADVQSCEGDAV